jgi:predicted Zn-dependent peptidase
VRAETSLGLDHGFFAISAGVNHPKLQEVLKAILEECNRLAWEPVPERELRRVKDHLLGTFLLSLETSDEVANFYGDQELMKRKMISPSEVAGRIEAIKAGDIQKLAGEIFKNDSLNLAIIGPLKDTRKLKSLLRFPKA